MTVKQIATAALIGAAALTLSACQSSKSAETQTQNGAGQNCGAKSGCKVYK